MKVLNENLALQLLQETAKVMGVQTKGKPYPVWLTLLKNPDKSAPCWKIELEENNKFCFALALMRSGGRNFVRKPEMINCEPIGESFEYEGKTYYQKKVDDIITFE
ncbi:MAG: hypothetical protein R3Y43_00255 [Alphaproteobacteria bacterium]